MPFNIDTLKAELHEALYLDLDEFGLETEGEELVSKFIGLQLRSAFQPIFSTALGKALGFEALLRPSIGPSDPLTPAFAFGFADNQGRLVKFDRVARTLHALNSLRLPDASGLLFLNVHPKLLVSVSAHGQVFERILHAHSVPTHKVVIEILESAIDADKQLTEAIGNYRDRGYHIAVDNFGSRHSSLDRLWKLSPDYVKLDLSIIHEAEHSAKVRRMLPKLIEIIQELGARPVVEGIENELQHKIALDSGGTLVQGYFLGRPATASIWRQDQATQPLPVTA
ncbi:diguanylate phosphodiesterase [Methylobacillus sp. MM3]|uniref:EAL domain-containing protein n=1 Tax=Methylobacillus sp. MM3 TaxID=1848039 RepID=UPI0007E25426|nr:EAL domain-containing protein [Methylobacillus sp. MM3]OAJ70942.1 diguanylate phosphodiesterase [Methylobacillus sp. MM3]